MTDYDYTRELEAQAGRAVRTLLNRDWEPPPMAIGSAEIRLSFQGSISAAKGPAGHVTSADQEEYV